MNLRPQLTQSQQLSLKQVLTPRLIHMLKTFNYAYADFVTHLQKQADENVVLEIKRYDELSNYYGSKLSSPRSQFMGRDISEFAADKNDASTLYEFVISQLNLECLSEKDYKVGEMLAGVLDSKGYISNFTEIKEKIKTTLGVSDRKVGDILKVIHSFEPEGVGARSLRECLIIQINQYDFENEKLRDVLHRAVSDHLDDFAHKKYDKIATSLAIESDGVRALELFIKSNLNPNPGVGFGETQFNHHIIPSFEISIQNDALHILNLEEKMGIQLGISDKYLKMLKDPSLDQKTRDFLETKLKSAQELMDIIKKRYENLQALVSYVASKQVEFFKLGTSFLQPLLQKEVAVHLGISQSTVSRIVSSKFIRTPHGIFSLKQLCPRNHFGKTGERFQEMIREICKSHPYWSDERIRSYLKHQHILIARRTIAKYRLLSGEASSFQRKQKFEADFL